MNLSELIVIFIVALLVIKPERLPEISYQCGKLIGKIRRFYHNTWEKTNKLL